MSFVLRTSYVELLVVEHLLRNTAAAPPKHFPPRVAGPSGPSKPQADFANLFADADKAVEAAMASLRASPRSPLATGIACCSALCSKLNLHLPLNIWIH